MRHNITNGSSICLNIGGKNIHRQVAKLKQIQKDMHEWADAVDQKIQTVIDFYQTVEADNAEAEHAE